MMKKAPNMWRLEHLFRAATETQTKLSDDRWVPARPKGIYAWRHRFKCAWRVFVGRCDAVLWPEDE